MKTKITYLLQKFDGIWSVPLAFVLFWLVGLLLSAVFGFATGTYDLAFIQPLFLAVAIVIGSTNAAVIGLRFTFRGLHRYLYGQKKEGEIVNYSKEDWLELTPIQRYCFAFGVFVLFVIAILFIYSQLV